VPHRRHIVDACSPIALIGRILQGGALPPSEVAADIPPAVDALVMQLLAHDRDERTASARALGEGVVELALDVVAA
jgi:hypothetical protein